MIIRLKLTRSHLKPVIHECQCLCFCLWALQVTNTNTGVTDRPIIFLIEEQSLRKFLIFKIKVLLHRGGKVIKGNGQNPLTLHFCKTIAFDYLLDVINDLKL